jgi:hypothetical protein
MSEALLTISQVCSRLPGARGAKRTSPSTIVRWITAGCPGRTGDRVRLRATRAGSRWLVAPADLDAFFESLGADPAATPTPTAPTRTTAQQRRGHEASMQNLVAKLGHSG